MSVKEGIFSVFRRRSRQYDLEKYIERQKRRGFIGALQEVDSTPVAPPVGYQRSVPLHLQIREMVRSEALRQAAESADMETFEEADDFDIEDDPIDPKSPYENDFDPDIRELLTEGQKAIQARSEKPAERTASPSPGNEPSGSPDPLTATPLPAK